jgi:hypothetical protein
MRNTLITLILPLFLLNCTPKSTKTDEIVNLSDTQLIAQAYGIDNFDDLEQLQYTFNVSRHDTLLVARTWVWQRGSGNIIMIKNQDTVNYQLANITEDLKKVDHSFINDKYWLLFPFHLVWDSNVTHTNMGRQTAPLSGKQLTRLTVQYGEEGGYTPGDAYDLYLDDNWVIREWVFRKSASSSPGSAISWENYADFSGLKIATNHYNSDTGIRIYFTDVEFK